MRLRWRLATDEALQPGPQLGQGLGDRLVAVRARGRVEEDPGATQVGVAQHPGDDHQEQAVVVDALERVGEDLPEQLVEPRGARELAL